MPAEARTKMKTGISPRSETPGPSDNQADFIEQDYFYLVTT